MKPTKFIALLIFFHSSLISISAQDITFKTSKANTILNTELDKDFHEVEVFELSGDLLSQAVNKADFDYTLNLKFGDRKEWEFELYPTDLFSNDALIKVLTENGTMIHPVPRNISFKGQVKGKPRQEVSLLIHDHYIYGHVTDGRTRTYIVSASRFVKNADQNLYLVYDREDQKEKEIGTCGQDTSPQFDQDQDQKRDHNHGEPTLRTGLCYDVDLGIVSDYSLFTDKGTVQGVIDHVVGVMMDVETDYETVDLDDALEFEIVEQVISICEDCDEWTTSTDPNTLLSDFTTWISNGGFNNTIDMGQLWSDRDFDGTTVGLAYRGSGLLCTAAHHILQDYTTDADNLRVMTSHEIGHNLNASHDTGSGDIMAPNVGTSTTWSAASTSTIDIQIDAAATASCITACSATPCDPVTDISVTNINATGFDISWTAATEGDYRLRVRDEEDLSIIHTDALTSSASMTINPTGWEICHTYMVMVENDCGSSVYSAPVSTTVIDSDQGCAVFSGDDFLDWGSLTVNFTDASINATSWSWDFGDGNTSTAQNPSNAYSAPGIYEVSLSVNAGAHTETKTDYIYVLPTGQSLPYTTGDGGDMDGDDFGTESLTASKTSAFEKGVPSSYFTNTTNCWVTNLSGNITSETNEMVLCSPSFDFSNVATASLSFDLGMENAFCNAPTGVQVQYSTDDGGNWTRLGSEADASWYTQGPTSGSCQLDAGVFADRTGWNYGHVGVGWSYDVASLTGNSSVIFRFVFSVASGYNASGYAVAGAMIDNFAISATLLPVDLTAFDGRLQEKVIALDWQTSSETNNDYFLIEKSRDGRNFEKLKMIPGSGNSIDPQFYQTIDDQPFIGTNYYRLTQFDYDGTYEVFDKIVTVDYDGNNEMAVRPNPTKGNQIQLVYQMERAGDLKIEIFNANGKLVKEMDVFALEARNVYDVSLDDLSNGVYFLRTVHRYAIESVRFVKTN